MVRTIKEGTKLSDMVGRVSSHSNTPAADSLGFMHLTV